MKKIFKYPLKASGAIHLSLPKDAKILCVQMQCGEICLWALVDPDHNLVQTAFRIYGTGHDVEDSDLEYIDTFQMYGGDLVFHVFKEL